MQGQHFPPLAVLGAGSWGTALALYLARSGQHIRIWSIESNEIQAMLDTGMNERYLPGHRLPPTLLPVIELADAIKETTDILLAIPSIGFRSTLQLLKPLLKQKVRFICATKGLDQSNGQLCNEICAEVMGTEHAFAALSGPSFAKEVAAGLPTAVMIASTDLTYAQDVCARFHSPIFHAYPITDIVGVEIAAVMKNVIAIATGIADGMQLGSNARSALITCGLQEITQLGLALGAKPTTFTTLAGIGDLILTCSDDLSRNRRLGLAIGKGKDIAQAEREIGQIVEGKRNAELVVALAERHQIQVPICKYIMQILQGTVSAKDALSQFLAKH